MHDLDAVGIDYMHATGKCIHGEEEEKLTQTQNHSNYAHAHAFVHLPCSLLQDFCEVLLTPSLLGF